MIKNQQKKHSKPAPNKNGLKIYRRLLTYVWVYKGLFSISILGYLLSSTAQPLFAELLKVIIDALQAQDRQQVLHLPFLFAGLIVVASIGIFIGSYFISRVSANIMHTLRCEIFVHYVHLPIAYFDANNSGYLISKITHNVGQVTNAATDALKIIIREGLKIVGLLTYLFYINWQLSLVFLAITPIIVVIVVVAGKRLRMLSKRLQESVGDLTRIVSEVVNGCRVIRSCGGQTYEIQRFEKQSGYHRNQSMKIAVTSALQAPIMQIIVVLALSGLMYFALLLMTQATAGEFVAYLVVAYMLPRSIKFIGSTIAKIQQGVAAAESLFEVLDTYTEPSTGTHVITDCKGEIEFKHVSFSYDNSKTMALDDVSFKIKSGTTVALVGASGSGKTTLVNLLMRFYEHQKGQIRIDDYDINTVKIENIRAQIAMVDQQTILFDDCIKNNIAYSDTNIDKQRLLRAAKDAFVMEFIDNLKTGLTTQIGEHGVKLSGGQRQRIALARAIYKNAPILILDEATSALDTQSERYIQTALARIQKNRTSLVIAHRLSTIENADIIFVMKQGKIIEQGSHQQLMHLNNAYAKLHGMQFKGLEVDIKQ